MVAGEDGDFPCHKTARLPGRERCDLGGGQSSRTRRAECSDLCRAEGVDVAGRQNGDLRARQRTELCRGDRRRLGRGDRAELGAGQDRDLRGLKRVKLRSRQSLDRGGAKPLNSIR